ncbi:MAG TPA: DMT family transporter, partial [Labilithrix sp.]|nr:DMT family transporter [Labilithrix sp.]
LLALRMGFSLPIFAAISVVEERRWRAAQASPSPMPLRDRLLVALLGFLGYYLASYLDFLGLTYLTASLERLVLFLYPTFALGISALIFGHEITRREASAVALSYAGILVAFGGERITAEHDVLVGSLLVGLSGLSYAAFFVGSGRLVARIGANRLIAQATTFSCVFVLLQFALTRPLAALHVPRAVYAYAMLTAVVATVLPTFLLGQGIRLVGANRAAIASMIGPVSTIALARVCLGERFGWLQAVGTALVLLGVARLGSSKMRART